MFGISLDDVIAFVILNKWWFFALVPFAIAGLSTRRGQVVKCPECGHACAIRSAQMCPVCLGVYTTDSG